ncbi:MAG: hypothetical protein AAFY91_04830 [Bacteroidota bacterium]
MNLILRRVCISVIIQFYVIAFVFSQDSTSVPQNPWLNPFDQAMQLTYDNDDFFQRLFAGTGFYAMNPELDADIDENILYLNPEFQPYIIILNNGLTDTVPARIQLLDQVIEVKYNGQDMQVGKQLIRSAESSVDGRGFVSFPQSLLAGEPTPLLELLYYGGEYLLYAHRRVKWREPSNQRTSYDAGRYKKRLYRSDMIYLFTSNGYRVVKKLKKLKNTDSAVTIGFTRFYFALLVLLGGIFGLSLANAVFVDEMTMDNNLELERKIDTLQSQIGELKEMLAQQAKEKEQAITEE